MTTPSLVSRTSSFRSLLLGALLVAAAASADTVGLLGHVDTTASVTSSATAGALMLDMSVGQKIVKVADLALTTNNATGLKLTIDPGTGVLSNGTGTVEFQVETVADVPGTAPAIEAFTIAVGLDNNKYVSGASGADPRDLYIAYSPAAVLDPGDYSATITLTVLDN